MARIICPFCLKPHDFNVSLQCEFYQEEATIPNTYVKEYNKVPPLWLVTIGFSRHGKTTYLAALTLVLENITRVWPDVYYRTLDQNTLTKVRQMRLEAEHGETPPPTPEKLPYPLLFSVYKLPESGSRCLVMYDVAGEIYKSLNQVEKYVPALKQASTTWFLVSLSDLEKDEEGKALPDLFHTYLTGMENLRIDLNGRNLIVVYTKGDILALKEFRDYLMSDPFQNLTLYEADLTDIENFSFTDYIKKMKEVSKLFEDYTRRRVKRGAAFINMVKASGMNLVFCVTSALGESPNVATKRLSVNARRYRVLDPFLWAITLESRESSRSIGLIVDASPDSQIVHTQGLVTNIWEELSDIGEVTTYYLGQSSPTSQPGQRVPENPPYLTRHRLIGPILEQASSNIRFIVISTGRIIDLEDFYHSEWQNRVLLLSLGENSQQDWSHKLPYRVNDNVRVFVDKLLRLYEGGEQ